MLFVNLPVVDVERSKAFFTNLGFSFNPLMTDDTAACMLVGEHGQQEGEPAEHLLLDHALLGGQQLPDAVREILVVGHREIIPDGG